MYRKPTLSKKINMFFENVFWISYILFMLLSLMTAVGMFVFGMYTTFFA